MTAARRSSGFRRRASLSKSLKRQGSTGSSNSLENLASLDEGELNDLPEYVGGAAAATDYSNSNGLTPSGDNAEDEWDASSLSSLASQSMPGSLANSVSGRTPDRAALGLVPYQDERLLVLPWSVVDDLACHHTVRTALQQTF